MTIKIVSNEKGNPPGKLADVELHFDDGPLDGLKLIGFSVWERPGAGGRNVTFPATQYAVHGERRSLAILPPIVDSKAQDSLRNLILEAFREHEESARAERSLDCLSQAPTPCWGFFVAERASMTQGSAPSHCSGRCFFCCTFPVGAGYSRIFGERYEIKSRPRG